MKSQILIVPKPNEESAVKIGSSSLSTRSKSVFQLKSNTAGPATRNSDTFISFGRKKDGHCY
jgi:hypothetical protein